MKLPVLQGLIRRRVLVNFRVVPEIAQRLLPQPFRPKLHVGHAIAGICLIRLEQVRPSGLPRWCGISSENAAHRLAVVWEDSSGQMQEGVYIPRRDTGSWLNHLAGGRLFPGAHHLADFQVRDDAGEVEMVVRSLDGGMALEFLGRETSGWPEGSSFSSLAQASAFFEGGCTGYSVTSEDGRLDGVRLEIPPWQVNPLLIERVESSFFNDKTRFPNGSVTFDHALIMRNVRHSWHQLPDFQTGMP